jgi:hypothetical protein
LKNTSCARTTHNNIPADASNYTSFASMHAMQPSPNAVNQTNKQTLRKESRQPMPLRKAGGHIRHALPASTTAITASQATTTHISTYAQHFAASVM